MVNVSVIIPTYNKGGRLALTLKSLCCQKTSVSYEVLLVDGGEKPNGEANRFLSQLPLRVVRVENRGRSGNRNTGIREAKGELLVFCDDDIITEPDFLEAHWRAHQGKTNILLHGRKKEIPYVRFFQDPRDTSKGLLKDYQDKTLSERLLSYQITEDDVENNMEKIRKWGHAQDRLERTVQHMFQVGITRYKAPWLTADTANMSIGRSFAIEIGMFDERFGLDWSPEDLEFGYRVYKAGGEFLQSDEKTDGYHLTHARKGWKKIAQDGFVFFQGIYPDESLISIIAEILVEQKESIDSLLYD